MTFVQVARVGVFHSARAFRVTRPVVFTLRVQMGQLTLILSIHGFSGAGVPFNFLDINDKLFFIMCALAVRRWFWVCAFMVCFGIYNSFSMK
jgi:hypothetical protein